ncbi:hypothetical protein VITFI_CDS2902 [Vitreoscilla filiformis]|uniref:Uncharacterized protein n=1 Tax=Vitreoscilla filiformis TaxID=63 RepID=A0A221KID6_VITFI|nr:hypothetical protein VITFI_CDS2902 [Vitreoscilla filiformis]
MVSPSWEEAKKKPPSWERGGFNWNLERRWESKNLHNLLIFQ